MATEPQVKNVISFLDTLFQSVCVKSDVKSQFLLLAEMITCFFAPERQIFFSSVLLFSALLFQVTHYCPSLCAGLVLVKQICELLQLTRKAEYCLTSFLLIWVSVSLLS